MILTAFHGFCMALADSVPGVSGGTIAFILGFYERFLDALHDLFQRDNAARKTAVVYLLKLGVGWCIGMVSCVILLSSLLIAGVYLPTIQAVHSLLGLPLAVFPGLCALGLGVVVGVGVSIHAIRAALRDHRGPMVWLILGLMLGSLYATGPSQPGHPTAAAERSDLPAACVRAGRSHPAGAGAFEKDHGEKELNNKEKSAKLPSVQHKRF